MESEVSPKHETRNVAAFNISIVLLEQMLQLPKDHYIVGAEWDFISRSIRLIVEGPDLLEIERGQIITTIYPSISIKYVDDIPQYTWNWNTPK